MKLQLRIVAGRPVGHPLHVPRYRPEGRDLEWLLPVLAVCSCALVALLIWGLSWLPW